MSDLPILFSGPMVLALLQGRKTQTRRLLMTAEEIQKGPWVRCRHQDGWPWQVGLANFNMWNDVKVPYAVGDRLYVRERIHKWLSLGNPLMAYVSYSADECEVLRPWPEKWTRDFAPPMHMPKEFSRITLVVTEVKVERLEELSDDDAIAEGVDQNGAIAGIDVDIDGAWWPGGPRNQFQRLWDRLNLKRAPWESNPWVVAYTFTVHKTNIERMAA